MKRLVCFIMIFVFVFSFMNGCGEEVQKDIKQNDEQTTKKAEEDESLQKDLTGKLVILSMGTTDNDKTDPILGVTIPGTDKLKDLFKKRLPNVEIEFLHIPNANWVAKSQAVYEAGEADIGYYTNQVWASKFFVDNAELLKNDPEVNEEDFLDGAIHYTYFRSIQYPGNVGKLIGLPIGIGANCLFYDKKIFDDWGVPYLSEPATYEEILEKAKLMTGINPKTNKQNYGLFFKELFLEWHAIGFDAFKPVTIEGMKLENLDWKSGLDKNNLKNYYRFVEEGVKYAPKGIASDQGNEKWLTEDNDIAINLDMDAQTVINLCEKQPEIIERFAPLEFPRSSNGKCDFPVVIHFAITKTCKDMDAAWEVIKLFAIDKEINELILKIKGKLPALKDASGYSLLENPMRSKLYHDRQGTMFITDEYTFWRTPIKKILQGMIAGKITADEAIDKTYTDIEKFINDKIAQNK